MFFHFTRRATAKSSRPRKKMEKGKRGREREIELQEKKKNVRYKKKQKKIERKTLVRGKRLNAIAFSIPERARGKETEGRMERGQG